MTVNVKFVCQRPDDLTTFKIQRLSRHGTVRGINLWHSDFGIHQARQKHQNQTLSQHSSFFKCNSTLPYSLCERSIAANEADTEHLQCVSKIQLSTCSVCIFWQMK